MLARGLTEAMGGRLQVCSVEGEGTSVEVVLPGPGTTDTGTTGTEVVGTEMIATDAPGERV
ncbi:hypothetical protein [Pseudonocardia sp. H11422]|uniref:hypothetical protein n=1 Tax=Pseudonocardia sp. H11422 TaxID=2835866 RepID=UPI001BDC3C3A|nr:hypothetical protein [Pseudonocardia sp. H11422]